MAKAKSEIKEAAIIDAACELVGERGLANVTTSAIAKRAGVAEGTLFTYFESKTVLVNALYVQIKVELARALFTDFPHDGTVRERFEHFWNAYVNWGIDAPSRFRALAALRVTTELTEESLVAGSAPFGTIERIFGDAIAQGLLPADVPLDFIALSLQALAETAIDSSLKMPGNAAKYRSFGFQLLWTGMIQQS